MTIEPQDFLRLGVAVLAGLLIGLQREFAQKEERRFAGARTFALIGLSGGVGALVAQRLEAPLIFVAVIVVVGALIAVGYVVEARDGSRGGTTQIAGVVALLAGAIAAGGEPMLATAVAVTTAVLLAGQMATQRFVGALTREDMIAALKLLVISALILPVLPNRPLEPPPLDVVNPQTMWLLVVLISGISFLGYALVKIVGPQRGIGLTGLLGGLASSTAVTLSFAHRSRENRGMASAFALAIIIAWTTMYARVALEVAVVNRSLLAHLGLPLLILGAVALAYSGWLWWSSKQVSETELELTNPFGLTPAIAFGALFAVIQVVSELARDWFGDQGIYAASILSGLADVDAITLSLAQLSDLQRIEPTTAVRGILLATLANTVAKGAIVVALGTSELRRAIVPGTLLLLIVGAILVAIV